MFLRLRMCCKSTAFLFNRQELVQKNIVFCDNISMSKSTVLLRVNSWKFTKKAVGIQFLRTPTNQLFTSCKRLIFRTTEKTSVKTKSHLKRTKILLLYHSDKFFRKNLYFFYYLAYFSIFVHILSNFKSGWFRLILLPFNGRLLTQKRLASE